MATDTATSQAQSVCNIAVGSFTGAGAVVDVTCGFKPRYVKLVNLTDRTVHEFFGDMAATHSLKAVAVGTLTDDTTSAITPIGGTDSNGYRGFQVPASVAIAAKEIHYIAFG